MKLAVISYKTCWRSPNSRGGFATVGGFPLQMQALAQLFDHTTLVLPLDPNANRLGELTLEGNAISVVPLTPMMGNGISRKLLLPIWLLRNLGTLYRYAKATDAIHAPIPGDVGSFGILLALGLRKPLFVRHCGNWLAPVTMAEKVWRWFMERIAGGRNVMLATGGAPAPPSRKNPNVHWIFSSSLTQDELVSFASPKSYPSHGHVRLIIAARQEMAKGAGRVIQALPSLARDFPHVSFEILGHGSAIAEFKRLAADLHVSDRVTFTHQLNHDKVMTHLRCASVFVFPTTSSDGFPKAVLEALATGLPVVATRVSVLPQLLGNGSGVLIDEATPEAIAQGIRKVLISAAVYEEMSRKAVATAQQYSLEAWRDTIGSHLSAAWGPLKSGDRGQWSVVSSQ